MKTVFRRAAMKAAVATLGAALSMGIVAQAVAGPHMLVDIRTGKVIEHEDAFQKWYPASLTKLMTAYVAFRQVKAGRMTLTTPMVMSKRAAAEPPSKIGLKPGQALTLDDALKVLLVKSANDVAFAASIRPRVTSPCWFSRSSANSRSMPAISRSRA
jgi:D-alanyl-D-alanine carboxypeptidase